LSSIVVFKLLIGFQATDKVKYGEKSYLYGLDDFIKRGSREKEEFNIQS
jgi:hypothetical protein